MPTTADRLVEAIGTMATQQAQADPRLLKAPKLLVTHCGTALVRSLAGAADIEVHRSLANTSSTDIEAAIAQVAGCLSDVTVSRQCISIPVSKKHRRRAGAFYTPRALVDVALQCTLEPWLEEHPNVLPSVLDPACGTGRFLLAAGDRLADRHCRSTGCSITQAWTHIGPQLHGRDIDPLAIAWLKTRIESLAGGDEDASRGIVCGDACAQFSETESRFDLLLGNPPFGTSLRTASGVEFDRKLLKARFPNAVEPYTDRAALFLLLASGVVASDGRIGMVLPLSFLAARDARGVRAHMLRSMRVSTVWASPRSVFDAQVHACMVAMRPRTGGDETCQRLVGLPPRAATSCTGPTTGTTWASLAAPAFDVPELPEYDAAGTIGEFSTATADFRDQYYGLRDALAEHDATEDGMPLLTVGLVDCAQSHWSQRPAKIHGQSWTAPVVRHEHLSKDMRRWTGERLVPKVLLPTQTRTLEPLLDLEGRWLPSVPLISILADDPDMLPRIAAVLACPLTTLIAKHRHLGVARSPQAIKLSARDVLTLPWPAHDEALNDAAAAFALAQDATSDDARQAHLAQCRAHSLRAFGLDASWDLCKETRPTCLRPAPS